MNQILYTSAIRSIMYVSYVFLCINKKDSTKIIHKEATHVDMLIQAPFDLFSCLILLIWSYIQVNIILLFLCHRVIF